MRCSPVSSLISTLTVGSSFPTCLKTSMSFGRSLVLLASTATVTTGSDMCSIPSKGSMIGSEVGYCFTGHSIFCTGYCNYISCRNFICVNTFWTHVNSYLLGSGFSMGTYEEYFSILFLWFHHKPFQLQFHLHVCLCSRL